MVSYLVLQPTKWIKNQNGISNHLMRNTNESRNTYGLASRIRRESMRLADFDYIPQCTSKIQRGLNAISLPLARIDR